MGNVNTNETTWSFSRESALGVPGTVWYSIPLNTPTQVGAEIETAESRPISPNRSRNKGSVVGLTSGFALDAELTMAHLNLFGDMFLFSSWQGVEIYDPSAVASDVITVASGTALAVGSLITYKGSGIAGNIGLHHVTAATATTITVDSTLVDEGSVPSHAVVEHAGFRGAAGDFEIDANGDLICTAADFTTFPIFVGGYILISGEDTANRFAIAANRGRARILTIAAKIITFDKRQNVFAIDNGATKEIEIFFPRHGVQVAVADGNYLKQSIHVEAFYPDLQVPGPGDMYQYPKGNHANTFTFGFPNKALASAAIEFLGTNTEAPTTSRLTGADTPIAATQDKVFNTTADFARLHIADESAVEVTASFKDFEVTFSNNMSPLDSY